MRGLAIGVVLLLTACAPDTPAPVAIAPIPPPKPLDLTAICPRVAELDQQALGKAFAALPDNSPLIFAMGDYKRMRDEARACLKAAKE